jgi:hypothetical protein
MGSMMKSRYLVLAGIIILLIANCTKPYTPKAITNAPNYLVVEGIINTGANDSTVIKLSRTIPLSAGVGTNPETGAAVVIQDESGQSYNLNETSPGIYMSDGLNLDNSHKYRLSVNTSDGKKYASDYVTPAQTPPIDSIGFTIKSNGIQIYANAHNSQNNTRYYRWDYNETWEYHAKYFSSYYSDGTKMAQRDASNFIYQCWDSGISNDIILGSSAKLTQDVIYQNPITFIAFSSEKIEMRYTILLKQYALTADGYNYFEQLRKNTEELGGIFDPQPSQLTGNVHCVSDPTLPAIGYVTAGTIQQKRVFIDNAQLPRNWSTTYPYDCTIDTAYYSNPKTTLNDVARFLIPLPESFIALNAIFPPSGPQFPIGFTYTEISCGDCSIRGTLKKPSFWKD